VTRGLFVTVEGIEGAGKTTHLSHIETRLREAGRAVLVTREPGGTAIGESIRDLLISTEMAPLTELLLIFAARAQHLYERIEPALEQGQIVLCDRFIDSTYAYQGGGRRLPLEQIAALETLVQGGLRPDLTLLFDVAPALGRSRSSKRSVPDRFEREDDDYFAAVRQCYLARAESEPERVVIIDASVEQEAVNQQLDTILRRHIE
jgi:dTMP kinase